MEAAAPDDTTTADDADDDEERPPAHDDGVLGFSLTYPGRAGLRTVLVGTVLLLFFWLIIPTIIAIGYFVRLTRAAGLGEPEPPGFEDWGGLFVDGLVLLVVFLPVVAVYAVIVFVGFELHAVAGIVVALIGSYLFPGMYANYAVRDDWKAAYDFPKVIGQATTSTYLIGYLLWVFVINGIGAIVATVLLVLSVLTIVGWIVLWPLIHFYWYGIDAALWGRVYNGIESA